MSKNVDLAPTRMVGDLVAEVECVVVVVLQMVDVLAVKGVVAILKTVAVVDICLAEEEAILHQEVAVNRKLRDQILSIATRFPTVATYFDFDHQCRFRSFMPSFRAPITILFCVSVLV